MTKEKKPKLKLTGQNGNAYVLLGLAQKAAKKAKWSIEKWNEISKEAKSGDYNHLLRTLVKYFDVK